MTGEQIEAELRLFKAYSQEYEDYPVYENTSSIESGILYTNTVSEEIKSIAERLYGIKPEELNSTFHKSFGTVLNTPIEKLVAQQLVHYFTTYGLESLDLYSSDLVYIPHEKLEIPELEDDIKLTVIHYISEKELTAKLMVLLSSGIALSKQTIADVMTLADYIDKEKFDEIKNKEIRIALYDNYGIVPKNNMDFLRYVVYKVTGSTLYIQNDETIQIIKQADRKKIYDYFYSYIHRQYGYRRLAEIFLRNKNIFLAFKTKSPSNKIEKELNYIINKIRRFAVHYHKPLKVNILDNLNSIKTMKRLDDVTGDLIDELNKVSVFREIRILNSISYTLDINRQEIDKPIVYRIRNGKVYAKDKNEVMTNLYTIIKSHLIDRVSEVLENKTAYIPNNVVFTAPTSEKQFICNMPEGSYIELPRKNNLVIGVHWINLDDERIDLDLKMMNLTEHYGWNASYLSREGNIIFSGDVTDAPKPNGATEVFFIKYNKYKDSFIIKLNDFTQSKSEVPFEFIVADCDDDICQNYVINPNNVLVKLNNKFDKVVNREVHASKTLGYVEVSEDKIRIYFKNFEDIKGRVSAPEDVNKNIFKYTDRYSKVQLTLNDLLKHCGVELLDSPYTEITEEVEVEGETLYKKIKKPVDINLSMDTLTKDSIIKILEGV